MPLTLGIVRCKALWATDVWFMNDAVEATYGGQRIERFLRSRNAQSDNERKITASALSILKSLEEREDRLQSFIACLSENGDQLSQWRAYGHSKGFSIGFGRVALERLVPSLPPLVRFIVRKVVYDDDEQRRLIDHSFSRVIAALSHEISEDEALQVAGAFVRGALVIAPSLKHPAFREEAEVRLQIFLERQADTARVIKFRDSSMGVTPYVEIPLCEPGTDQIEVMREVVIGPQRHPAEARRATMQLLEGNGLGDIDVRLSQVPLRS
jgi:hypothetical protein